MNYLLLFLVFRFQYPLRFMRSFLQNCYLFQKLSEQRQVVIRDPVSEVFHNMSRWNAPSLLLEEGAQLPNQDFRLDRLNLPAVTVTSWTTRWSPNLYSAFGDHATWANPDFSTPACNTWRQIIHIEAMSFNPTTMEMPSSEYVMQCSKGGLNQGLNLEAMGTLGWDA